MKRSKQHQLLKDVVRSTKAIRLNNFIPVAEVDDFIGQPGICKAIESASWQFEPNHTSTICSINLFQFISYMTFIQSNFMVYNNAAEKEQAENSRKQVQKDMGVFDGLIEQLKNLYEPSPKFI